MPKSSLYVRSVDLYVDRLVLGEKIADSSNTFCLHTAQNYERISFKCTKGTPRFYLENYAVRIILVSSICRPLAFFELNYL